MLHSRTSGSASVGLIATLVILSVAPRADAQYSWSAPATGFYDVGTNWSPAGGPPGALDNATINAGGAGPYTVTLRDNRSIHMLTLNSTDLTFVQSAGMFTVGTGISIPSGTYQLNGGTISGGTINGSSTGRLVANGNSSNTLDAVTVAQSALDLSAGTTVLRLTNGTDFSVLNTLTLGGNSSLLRLEQSGTLHNLNLTLASTAVPNNAALQLYGGQSVTLASTVTVTAGPGVGNNVGASQLYGDLGVNNLTNQGILQANISGNTLKINPSGIFTNAVGGQVIASNGGTVNIGTTNWVNQGTITVNASTLNLTGDFNSSGIGTIVRTGGTVNLSATATGGTFDLQSFGGNVNLVGGHVMGGTLFSSGSARLTPNGTPANSLSGVMVGANALDLSAATTVLRLLNGTDFSVLNTVTLGGNSSLFRVEQSGTLHNLNLTLATAAAPSNAALQLYGGQSVTLASTVTVTAGPGVGNNVGASQIYGDLGVNNLTNQGILQANVAGNTLPINPSGVFTNAVGGQVIAANGGTVNIATTNWINQGTIVVNAGTLNIQGDFAANNVGTYVRTGGTINLSATLTATGGTLDLQAFGGNLNLVAGRILGGTLTSSGSARLIPNGNPANTLDGVMVGANALDLSAGTTVLRLVNNTDFSVPTTLTLGGNSSLLRVEQSGTLHNLDLTLASAAVPSFAAFQLYGGQSVTLASTVTVTAGPGFSGNNVGASHLYSDLGVNNLTNQGILQANVSGRTLSINPSGVFTNAVGGQVIAANGATVNIASASWANQGTITVNASTLNLQGDVAANNVGTFVRAGGTINLSATVDATGGTLDLQAFGGNVNLQGGRILGGTLISSGSARLLPDSNLNNRLDGVNAAVGVIDMSAGFSRLTLTGGANFSGTGAFVIGPGAQVFLSQATPTHSGISFTLGNGSLLSAEGGNTATLGAATPATLTVSVNPGVGNGATIGTSFLASANNTVLINQGTIQFDPASANATLTLQTNGGPTGNAIQNQGIIAANVVGTTVTLTGPIAFTNTGTLTANGGTINIPSTINFTNFNAGTLTGGTYQAFAGSQINLNGRVITTLGPETAVLLDTPSAVFTAANSIANNNGSFTISNGRQHMVPTFTNAGTLVVGTAQGDLATLTSNVQVNSGGIVRGTGTIAGSVSLASGSTLAPGTSPGILTVTGPVTMTSGATFGIQLGGTTVGTGYSQLNLAGGGSIALNNATLATSINYVPGPFDSWTIINGGSVSGQFLNHPNNSVVVLGTFMGTTYKATIVYNATSVGLINPVPEPTTILAMCAAAAGVTIGVRRRLNLADMRAA